MDGFEHVCSLPIDPEDPFLTPLRRRTDVRTIPNAIVPEFEGPCRSNDTDLDLCCWPLFCALLDGSALNRLRLLETLKKGNIERAKNLMDANRGLNWSSG